MAAVGNHVRAVDPLQRLREKNVARSADKLDIRRFGAKDIDRLVHLPLRQRGDHNARRMELSNRFARHLQPHHAGAAEDQNGAAVGLCHQRRNMEC